MKKWVLKAIVQKIISFLPGGHRINFLFQKYVTKGVFLSDEYFLDRLDHAKNHIQAFDTYAQCKLDTTLELGTGWYPVVPVCLFLRDAEKIYTVDISRLCNKKRLITTLEKFIEYHESGKLQEFITVDAGRWSELSAVYAGRENLSFEGMLSKLRLNYLLKDARRLELPSSSVSLVHSNNTFEHVYAEALEEILREFKRITARGGVMSHFIDMSDHFAHSDKSITIYNYLRFSAKQWKRIDNSIQPQNRLRIADYRNIYKRLDIPVTYELSRPGSVDELKTVPVHTEFSHIPPHELAVSHSLLVSLIQ